MAFAHQYTHAGTATASLQAAQILQSTKSTHSPTSPSSMDAARALVHESGLPLLHFLPRMNGLAESVYGQGPLTPNGLGVEPSAFYPMGSPPGHLPGSPEHWKGLAGQSPVMYPFDPMLAVHPYASFYGGLDLNNAARRKNATRETTSALKAWLYEHRKNPYPTKGEKIMLAIITKMTLTQVSTWFANARRRLKKESKSGWNGKDRDLDDSDFETDGEEKTNENQGNFGNTSRSCSGNDSDDDDVDIKVTSDLSDISDAEPEREEMEARSRNRLEIKSMSSSDSSQSQSNTNRQIISPLANSEQSNTNEERNSVLVSPIVKPKIWSIEEIMNKDSTKPKHVTNNQQTSPCTNNESSRFLQKTENQESVDSIHNQRYTSIGLISPNHTVSHSETTKSTSDKSSLS